MSCPFDLSVILLHEQMLNKEQRLVTTSLTLIDLHDIARSSKTYGLRHAFVAHPSAVLRKLALTLKQHWEEGFGASYNPNRKEALETVQIVEHLDQAVALLKESTGKTPRLIATSAKDGGARLHCAELKNILYSNPEPFLLMLGTGWGMSDALLHRAEYFLEPIKGASSYNHLSVRSACAVLLDRLLGTQ